jgi:hypothetical protein
MTCPSSGRDAGHNGRVMSTSGSMHRIPKMNRRVRNENGGAYSMPIFEARNPDPQMVTKYQARNESNQR